MSGNLFPLPWNIFIIVLRLKNNMVGSSSSHYSICGNDTFLGMYSESSIFSIFYIFTNIIILKYLLLIGELWVSNQNQKIIERTFCNRKLQGDNFFEPCFQLLTKNESGQIAKSQQVYLGEKEEKRISAKKYSYSRCWKFWTPSSIGTSFWHRLNHDAGTSELSRCVWHSNIQEEKSVCHNQARKKIWTSHPTFSLESSLQRRTKFWSKLPTPTLLWTNLKNPASSWDTSCLLRSAVFPNFLDWFY